MNHEISCIIVDDEFGAIEILEAYVNKVPWLTLQASYSDPLEALNHLAQNRTDLVFLDINMPDLGGMQLARLIHAKNRSIIFCTAYAEHALESYEVNALDYLLKPIPFERFLAAVNRYQAESDYSPDVQDRHPAQIFIKSGSHIHQVDTSEISLISKDGHYIVLKVKGRELLSRMTFSQLLELLPSDKFIQVHRSYVVALDKIEVIQKQFIRIEGKEIPIGDAFKEAFFNRVNVIGN